MCVCVCVFVDINLGREWIPALDHSVQIKKKNLSTAHLLITKPHAQSPIHELPYKKRYYSFFEEK